ALSDEILLNIEKPARYIGNEVNMVVKNPADVDVRCVFAFPDVYDIGMSHLGMQILCHQFNLREDVYCERVFSPWPDLHKIMKEQQIPLFALETQDPICEFDWLLMTLQYEMCYPNILQILDLGQIPFMSEERNESDPIVIGGGPCTYNPEPIADFFDIIYIGEGETVYDELLNLYKRHKKSGHYSRRAFLREASHIPGLYVPSLYEVTYHEDGTIASFSPLYEDVPRTIQRQVVEDLSAVVYPDKPLVPFIKITQDRVVLEIQRGCIRGCRFCQAGMIYRPLRERDLEFLKEKAYAMLTATGQEEISLSSLSSSDYSQLEELLNYLIDEFKLQHVNISLPSLRIDNFSLDVMSKVQDIKKSSLTFAPEAGSQRLRDVINKGLTEEDILHGAGLAFDGGWQKVKLYFMLGQPTETVEDMQAIAELAEKIAERYYEIPKEQRHGKCQITVSTSFFVPKPFTPFQWSSICTKEDFLERAHIVNESIRSQLNRKSIRYNWHEADVTLIEGILARGDRRLSDALIRVYEKGGIFAAWSDFFEDEMWEEAFRETGIDTDFYTVRERGKEEVFPWEFIDIGVSKQFLWNEWQKAQRGEVTPNCRQRCSGCGAKKYKGGVCYENTH
ncbi:MAG: TIGR03960 family B12-binding radical SAM protein, partial [Lachnospiraceae bacterium]|nr:TIGR03960 family B12-binding radical SAM protein [Lachnospiraceae bacterium]